MRKPLCGSPQTCSPSVQSLSHVRFFGTPWTVACQASLSITNFWSLLKLMSIELVMTSNHLILCRPLLLLPSIFPSIRVFSNESALCIRWLKYGSFSISSSNEYSGLISFRIHWFFWLWNRKTKKINCQIKFYHLCYCDTCIIFYYCLFGQVKFKVLSVALLNVYGAKLYLRNMS